jgi:hypothetical protein
MDFMRMLKSFEEFLYEVVSWMVFYPITLWRTIRHPGAMMRYADVELCDDASEQYTDTLSPPLFLVITLFLAHGLELSFSKIEAPWIRPSLLESDSNLILFRAIAYSVFPLLMAAKLLRRRGTPIDRSSLRPPFYSQCYVAAPFALGINVASLLLRIGHEITQLAGLAALAVVIVWYATIETRWFRADLKISTGRALAMVTVAILQGVVIVVICAIPIVYGTAPGGT